MWDFVEGRCGAYLETSPEKYANSAPASLTRKSFESSTGAFPLPCFFPKKELNWLILGIGQRQRRSEGNLPSSLFTFFDFFVSLARSGDWWRTPLGSLDVAEIGRTFP